MILYVSQGVPEFGGHYGASETELIPLFAEEVRFVSDFPEEAWSSLMRGGEILAGPDGTFDAFWKPYFDSGTPYWKRTVEWVTLPHE